MPSTPHLDPYLPPRQTMIACYGRASHRSRHKSVRYCSIAGCARLSMPSRNAWRKARNLTPAFGFLAEHRLSQACNSNETKSGETAPSSQNHNTRESARSERKDLVARSQELYSKSVAKSCYLPNHRFRLNQREQATEDLLQIPDRHESLARTHTLQLSDRGIVVE